MAEVKTVVTECFIITKSPLRLYSGLKAKEPISRGAVLPSLAVIQASACHPLVWDIVGDPSRICGVESDAF